MLFRRLQPDLMPATRSQSVPNTMAPPNGFGENGGSGAWDYSAIADNSAVQRLARAPEDRESMRENHL